MQANVGIIILQSISVLFFSQLVFECNWKLHTFFIELDYLLNIKMCRTLKVKIRENEY